LDFNETTFLSRQKELIEEAKKQAELADKLKKMKE